jgi:hypothetical protein
MRLVDIDQQKVLVIRESVKLTIQTALLEIIVNIVQPCKPKVPNWKPVAPNVA